MKEQSKDGAKVSMYKFANLLKARMGARFQDAESGFLAPEAISEADALIAKLCVECPRTIGGHLESLAAQWAKMKTLPDSPERAAVSQKVFTLAHEIKDVGSMCGYELIAYFAESLRDYIDKTELNLNAQQVIIQAHLDAMTFVHRQDIKKDGGPAAEELKRMVKVAIDKYK